MVLQCISSHDFACQQTFRRLFLAPRLGDFDWPPNAYVGVTVTRPKEVRAAAKGLGAVHGAGFKWVSVEPYMEAFDPTSLLEAGATFYAVGGRSRTRWSGEFQPPEDAVRSLIGKVWEHGGHVYVKDNLDFRGHIPFPGAQPASDPEPQHEDQKSAADRPAVRPNGPRTGSLAQPSSA